MMIVSNALIIYFATDLRHLRGEYTSLRRNLYISFMPNRWKIGQAGCIITIIDAKKPIYSLFSHTVEKADCNLVNVRDMLSRESKSDVSAVFVRNRRLACNQDWLFYQPFPVRPSVMGFQ